MYQQNANFLESKEDLPWSFREGYNQENRREQDSLKLRHGTKYKGKRNGTEKAPRSRIESNPEAVNAEGPPVVIDENGEEYEVYETAKEAIQRLVKSDPRLAAKYESLVKKLDKQLSPYETTYQMSFMPSTNIFPNIKAYELAAEEFERSQDMFDETKTKDTSKPLNEWDAAVLQYFSKSLDQKKKASAKLADSKKEEPGASPKKDTTIEDWVQSAYKTLSKKS